MEPFDDSWSSYQRGLWGERAAARALWRNGYWIEAHRWTAKDRSDIDLIAARCDLLLFVEVKVRGEGSLEPLAEAHDEDRMARLRNAISDYLHESRNFFTALRVHGIHVAPMPGTRDPAIMVERDYLNPRSIAAWKGNPDLRPDDGLSRFVKPRHAGG